MANGENMRKKFLGEGVEEDTTQEEIIHARRAHYINDKRERVVNKSKKGAHKMLSSNPFERGDKDSFFERQKGDNGSYRTREGKEIYRG